MAHRRPLDCGLYGTKTRTNPPVDAHFTVGLGLAENVFELQGQSIRVTGRKRGGDVRFYFLSSGLYGAK